jgi:hypothetical protein
MKEWQEQQLLAWLGVFEADTAWVTWTLVSETPSCREFGKLFIR